MRLKLARDGHGQLPDDLIEEGFGGCTQPFLERLRVGHVSTEPSRSESNGSTQHGMHISECGWCWTSPGDQRGSTPAI